MSTKLYLYCDMLSQPSRAVYTFLRFTGISFEACRTRVLDGETKAPEFAKMNPRKKVPVLKDGDFCLSESIAIFRYIADKYQNQVADHWYPRDRERRARVDEYLEFQHLGTRQHYSTLFTHEKVLPMMTGQPPDKEETEKLEQNVKKITHVVQKTFLGEKRFLCGEQISIADVFAAHEMIQVAGLGLEPLDGFPQLSKWLERVSQELHPVFGDTIEELYSFGGKQVPQKYRSK